MRVRPYKGDGNFIFVSYSHKDMKEVFELVEQLQKHGYNVWFDEGIDPGTEWDEMIARHIQDCSYFIGFITENYIKSQNCRDELNFARDLDKDRLLVYGEEVDLPIGMQMRMNRLQAIYKNKYQSPDDFYEIVFNAYGIETCKSFGAEAADDPDGADEISVTKEEIAPESAEPEKRSEEPDVVAESIPSKEADINEEPEVAEARIDSETKTATKPAALILGMLLGGALILMILLAGIISISREVALNHYVNDNPEVQEMIIDGNENVAIEVTETWIIIYYNLDDPDCRIKDDYSDIVRQIEVDSGITDVNIVVKGIKDGEEVLYRRWNASGEVIDADS